VPWSRGFGLAFGFEGFSDDSAIGFFEKDFDFAFGFLELFLAFGGQADALFEKFHGVVERELRAFEFADDFLETGEAALEIGLLGEIGFFGGRSVHVFFRREQFTAGRRRETSRKAHRFAATAASSLYKEKKEVNREGERDSRERPATLSRHPSWKSGSKLPQSKNQGLRVRVCLRVADWAESENGAMMGMPSYQ